MGAIGGYIAWLCNHKAISYVDLKKMTGLSQTTINRIVHNRDRAKISTLKKIAEALGLTLQELLNGDYQVVSEKSAGDAMDKRGDMETRLSENLKALRIRRHISKKELAERAGVNLITILRLERNTTIPRNTTVRRLAEALGVTAEELKFGQFVKEDILKTYRAQLKNVTSSINKLCEMQEMTYEELARRANLDKKTIYNVITGKHTPRICTLKKLAEVFNVSIEQLLGEI
ncbi:MAG: transcriptional regulator [Clostridia bacterium]|nr:transcriptional regulator [Clostridia bacterium]